MEPEAREAFATLHQRLDADRRETFARIDGVQASTLASLSRLHSEVGQAGQRTIALEREQIHQAGQIREIAEETAAVRATVGEFVEARSRAVGAWKATGLVAALVTALASGMIFVSDVVDRVRRALGHP